MDSSKSPPSQRAIIIGPGEKVHIQDNIELPQLQTGEFLIRTDAVAVNPSDTKMRGDFVTVGGILGTDYAGTVVALGPQVASVKIGDRVCGAQNAMNASTPLRGSFGEYNISAGKVWLKLPASLSTESGTTLGAGISTAGLGIRLLHLPLPDAPVDKSAYVLVYGGGTATATIAIQLLRFANMTPVVTCSPTNAARVKELGAEESFDYHDPDCASKIVSYAAFEKEMGGASNVRSYTNNNLRYALDCITTVESTKFCFAALGRAGGRYVSLDPFAEHAATRATVKTDWVLGPSIFGDGSTWPAPYGRPPSEEIRVYSERLWSIAQKLVDEGKLKHHPLRVLDGGLDGIHAGLDLVRSGKLSGEKCVVRFGKYGS